MTAIDQASHAPGSLAPRAGSRWRRDLLFFAIAAVIVGLDQFTKWLVRSNLGMFETWPSDGELISVGGMAVRIIRVTNSGAAFGILQGQTTFLVFTSMLGLAAILLYYIYPPMDYGIVRVALGMQLGGAIGNFIDRVRFGEVTDFVDVGSFPTFNVADSSISISIVIVLLFFTLQEAKAARDANASEGHAAAHDD